uniref:Uncharacterized protein n=1 Tax=Anguilla anguilla TaxID=7936 RepID=A0A0E9UGE8_ANGAN
MHCGIAGSLVPKSALMNGWLYFSSRSGI